MALHITSVGTGPPRVAFLHGLLGQGKNLATIAKAVADTHPGLLVDLPDHGRSPWSDDFSYAAMADVVAAELRARDGGAPLTVLGHSMGGKVAMMVALRHPDLVGALVVADIAPDASARGRGFDALVSALVELDLGSLTSRADADAALAQRVPSAGVRSFLLQNLHRDGRDGWRWLPNLALLQRSLDDIADWPADADGTFEGPVLWLRGADSDYVTPASAPAMRALFPRYRLITVKNAAHWLHADQPDAVARTLAAFLASPGVSPR